MGPRAGSFQIVRAHRLRDLREELADDVRTGLAVPPRSLPPKYFYDARGSQLFEAITRLPEYYPTRAETEILEEHADDLAARARPVELVELGSGSSRKTRLLLEAMHDHGGDRYVAFDVSEAAVRAAADALVDDYPWLEVVGVVGDFQRPWTPPDGGGGRLVCFLGSTIGNLEPDRRVPMLRRLGGLLVRPDDRLLVGFDLVKDPKVLVAAYDDSQRVTAEFNRNVLNVVNRELDGDLPVDAFEHRADWNVELERIEIRLVTSRPVQARLRAIDLDLAFERGEAILTELSCKFTRARVERELGEAGLALESWLTDGEERFALAVARSPR